MATTARTDIHRPSAPEFDPEKYELHGVYDLAPEWDAAAKIAERQAAVNALVTRGYRFGGSTTGGCGHCGSHFRYGALVAHPEAREMMFIGETCLEGRFSMSRNEYVTAFRRVRDTAAADRQRAAHAAMVAEFKAANPEVADILADTTTTSQSPDFLAEIAVKLARYGDLSERQCAAVLKTGRAIRARAARTRPAAPVVENAPAPEGRVTVTGVITGTKWQDSAYGEGALKMRVQADAGYAVWVTVPRSLDAANAPVRGRRVEFTATLERSARDETFAFGSSPAAAKFLD